MPDFSREDLVAKSKRTILPFVIDGKDAFVTSVPVSTILECNKQPEDKQGTALALQCLCTKDGERLLSDDDTELLEALHDLSTLSAIVDKCRTVNGLNKKGFDEIAKN